MAYTLANANTMATGIGSSLTPTCASTAAGNLLVCSLTRSTSSVSSVVTFPAGWVRAMTPAYSGGYQAEIWYLSNCAAAITSVAISWTLSTATGCSAQVLEFHDAAGANTAPLDVTGILSVPGATTPFSIATSGAVAAAGELAVTAFYGEYASATKDTVNAGTGFTQAGQFGTAVKQIPHQSADYQLSTGSGVVTDAVTFTGPFTAAVGVIATFATFNTSPPSGTVRQQAVPVHLTSLTGPVNVTLPNPTAAGNTLVALCHGNGTVTANPHVSAVTLGGSADHWASAAVLNSGTFKDAEIWYDPNCAAGQTAVAVTYAGGGGTGTLFVTVYEVSGVLTADKTKTAAGTVAGGVWTSGASATTTQAAEIFFGTVISSLSTAPPVTGVGTWTTQTDTSTFGITAGYQIVAATGTATYSGTQASGDTTTAVATFYVAAPPGGILPQQARMRRPAVFTRIAAPGRGAVYSR